MKIAPFRVLGFLIFAFAAVSRSGWAQNPGPNVNIINPAPGSFTGDIFERQVETDIAASPVNSGRAMAGFITYQTLGPSASAWCGYSETNNGGKTWNSNLVPGFPQDTSSQGTSSPLRTLGLQQCSDPALAAAPPNATDPAQIYYGALGLTNGSLTAAFVVTFRDLDDGSGHFQYVRTVVTDSGNPSFNGQVMDKPAIAYDPPSAGFPQGIVHFTWVDFTGSAKASKFQSKVMYSRSTDGGRTFSTPVKLNNTFGQNQATAITRLTDGTIYAVWRTFNSENGIQAVKISRAGSISSPVTIAGGANFFPYDQPTLPDAGSPNFAAFRANAFPTITADRNGKLIAAWQEYVDSSGNPASPGGSGPSALAIPKIVITSSSDGVTWAPRHAALASPPAAVQVQPILKAGGGLVSLFYYDSSNDTHVPALNFVPEFQQWVYTGTGVGTDAGIDRRMEVWVAQAALKADGSAYTSQDANGTPVFGAPVQVSQYATSTATGQILPRTPGFPDAAINLPNVKTTANGTVPFVGDYPGMAPAVEFLPSAGAWRLALEPGDYQARTYYVVWTDTRNVEFPGFSINGDWGPYSPASCVNPGTRNSKIFFSAISPGLVARWSGTARPLQLPTGAPVPPAFTVSVENTTSADRFFQIIVADQAPAEDWSFVQTPAPPDSDPADLNQVDVEVLQTSSVTVGLFYRWRDSSMAAPVQPVVVNIQEVDSSGNLLSPPGLTTSLTFSPSGSAIQLTGSTVQALSVSGQSVNSLAGVNSSAAQPSDTTIQNFGFKNFGFKNFPPDQDVTWSVSNNGLLPTSGNAFVNVLNAQTLLSSGSYEFNLFVYVTHSVPALFGCTAGQLLQDQIISNIPITSTSSTQAVTDFGFKNFGFKNFGFKNFPPPDIVNATFVADTSGTKVTLRSTKDPNAAITYTPTPTNGVVSEGDVAQVVNPGATAPSVAFNDTTPPVIAVSITNAGTQTPATAGPAGWYSNAVTVTWNPNDPGSGIVSNTGCDTVTVTSGTQTLTCSATNGAGLSASNSVTIQVDTTPPVITPIVSGTPGANGWYVSSVTVSWNVTDPESGIASSTGCGTVIQSTETTGITFTCSATNGAGLSNSASVTIKVDLTPPVIIPTVTGTLGLNGWYVSNVGISWSVSDNISGVASSTGCGPYAQTTDTTGTTVTCSAANGAGLRSSNSLFIKRDATPPVITITAPANNANYLLNASVASNYGCADATSGVGSCKGPVSSGANIIANTVSLNPQQFTVTATDAAGNTASATYTYFVRYNFLLTPPKSPANQGSSVPLVWQLKDAHGALVIDMTSLVTLSSLFNNGQPANGPCTASLTGSSPTTLYSPATGATGGSNFRQVSSGYQFNWASSTADATGKGCYTIVFQLKDDSGGSPNFTVLDPSRLWLASVQLK